MHFYKKKPEVDRVSSFREPAPQSWQKLTCRNTCSKGKIIGNRMFKILVLSPPESLESPNRSHTHAHTIFSPAIHSETTSEHFASFYSKKSWFSSLGGGELHLDKPRRGWPKPVFRLDSGPMSGLEWSDHRQTLPTGSGHQ